MPRRASIAGNKRRALTRIELATVMVLVLLGLAVALPALQRARENSRRAHTQERLRNISTAVRSQQALRSQPPDSTDLADAPARGNDLSEKPAARREMPWVRGLIEGTDSKPATPPGSY